jgi:hypothetical protein
MPGSETLPQANEAPGSLVPQAQTGQTQEIPPQ